MCTSASIKNRVEDSERAKRQLDDLHKEIKKEAENYQALLLSHVEDYLKSAKISDAKSIFDGSYSITQYLSESSRDNIEAFVNSELEKGKLPGCQDRPNTSFESVTIETYINLVHSAVEDSKSSISHSQKASFNAHRLQPGLFLFLFTKSYLIRDNRTFGSEPVTATIIIYNLIESKDDIKHQAAFDGLQLDRENYLKFKRLQAELMEQLAKGEIDYDTWQNMDNNYSKVIAKFRARLDASSINK